MYTATLGSSIWKPSPPISVNAKQKSEIKNKDAWRVCWASLFGECMSVGLRLLLPLVASCSGWVFALAMFQRATGAEVEGAYYLATFVGVLSFVVTGPLAGLMLAAFVRDGRLSLGQFVLVSPLGWRHHRRSLYCLCVGHVLASATRRLVCPPRRSVTFSGHPGGCSLSCDSFVECSARHEQRSVI